MERLQQREGSEIKAIEKATKKIAYNAGEKPEESEDVENISSLLQ